MQAFLRIFLPRLKPRASNALYGDMEVVSKLTPEQEEWFKSVPTTPKEIILKQLFDMQK